MTLPGMPQVPDRDPGDDRTRRRSWTAHARQLVAEGIHPLTRDRARPDLGTCGECVHRVHVEYHVKRWPKCDLGPNTHGETTDVRAWWPACKRFDPAETPDEPQGRHDYGVSLDAARYIPPTE